MLWDERLENKLGKITKRRQIWVYIGFYTIVFILCFILVYSPFLLNGKSFIWQNDGRNQHNPYMIYVGRYLRRILINAAKGDFSIPLYDLNIGPGDDVIGFLNSQWATDPLLFLSAFVPVRYSEYLYSFLAFFRVYLSGLSFLFLCSYFKKNKTYSLIGSVIYCFSGYAITYPVRHPGFVNPMIILPLMIIGTDKILRNDRPYILIFAVFYAGLCGYYHLYMMTIMICVYAVILFFDLYKSNRVENFVLIFRREAFAYCLGIGLSAMVFFPGVAEFLNAGRSGHSNYLGSYEWSYYCTHLLRLIAPPGSKNDIAVAAIVLYSLALLFFLKRRRSLKILTFVSFAFYMTSIGGLIMNGFQYSSNRWTFGIVLVLSFVVVEMLQELLNLSGKQQLVCLVVLCIYIFVAFLTETTRKTTYILVGVAFLSLTAMILMMQIYGVGSLKLYDGQRISIVLWKKRIRTFLCLILVVVNVGINGVYKFASDQGNYTSEFPEFGYEVDRLENAIEREVEPYLLNNPAGRADGSSFFLNNSMVWRIPGILYYSSIANKNVSKFWNEMENRGNWNLFLMPYTDQRTIANTLFSTKYHIESEKNEAYVPYGYIPIKKTELGNSIYENDYALPWGYTYESIISYTDLEWMNGVEKQETMLQAIALEDAASGLLASCIEFDEYMLPYEIKLSNCKWENKELVISNVNATITLNFSMPVNVEGYVRLVGLNTNGSGLSSFWLKINDENITKHTYVVSDIYEYYYGRENYLFSLGYSSEERTSLVITFPYKGKFKLNDIELFALPMDNYPERVEALRAEPLENIEWSTNRLTGTVDLSKDKVLCVSVPYSKGWSAKVDGENVEILRGNYMFMAIPLTAGHHDIEFTYFTPGLKLGIGISFISWGILIGIFILDKKRKKKQRNIM